MIFLKIPQITQSFLLSCDYILLTHYFLPPDAVFRKFAVYN